MRKTLLTLFVAGAALLYAAPILFMVFSAELSLQNYADVFARVSFGRYLFNSLFITLSVVLLGLIINSLAGYICSAALAWPTCAVRLCSGSDDHSF